MYYYQRLKDLREDADMTQADVSAVIEVSRQQYQLYECGKREIPFHMVIRLAEYYNVSTDYIAGRCSDKKGLCRSDLSDEECDILRKYMSLNQKNRGKITERLDMLVDENKPEK